MWKRRTSILAALALLSLAAQVRAEEPAAPLRAVAGEFPPFVMQVDAVVLAAPGLHHFEQHAGAGRVRVVGPEFRKNDLSFMFPLQSPLRRKVNSALVALHEDGTYERLREKWFGKE